MPPYALFIGRSTPSVRLTDARELEAVRRHQSCRWTPGVFAPSVNLVLAWRFLARRFLACLVPTAGR
jgi:hypothetical protein